MTNLRIRYYTTEDKVERVTYVKVPGQKQHIEEYLVDAHKILSKELGLDSKQVKILDWEYQGRD